MIGEEISSESHSAVLSVLLALSKKIHVLLAHINLVGVLLQAAQE
jgi:hypothetical protein